MEVIRQKQRRSILVLPAEMKGNPKPHNCNENFLGFVQQARLLMLLSCLWCKSYTSHKIWAPSTGVILKIRSWRWEHARIGSDKRISG